MFINVRIILALNYVLYSTYKPLLLTNFLDVSPVYFYTMCLKPKPSALYLQRIKCYREGTTRDKGIGFA